MHISNICASVFKNQDTTEIVWFRFKSNLANLKQLDMNLNICSAVRDLGVILDSELSMRRHVGTLSSTLLFSSPSPAVVAVDARPIVATTTRFCIHLTRIDFCNAVLAGLPVTCLLARDHVTYTIRSLHCSVL